MVFCSANCRKWTTFGVSLSLILIGIVLAFLWISIVQKIVNHELSLADSKTTGFTMWKETPIPMYLAFRFFNWTNYEEYQKNHTIKPNFTECGPYTYSEHHIRENITFFDDYTITYYNRRIWKYAPERSVGSLNDLITTFNPILATVANMVKFKHIIVREGVNFFLQEKKTPLAVTKTVNEFIFEGYDDPMLDLLHQLHIKGINVPFTKFGWFVDRNNSVEYDGIFNMNSGGDDIEKLGIINTWNNMSEIPYWKGQCQKVVGTSGELWYPPRDAKTVEIFSNDLCSPVSLSHQGEYTVHGIEGHKYVGSDRTLDNGTKYPEMSCFLTDGVQQRAGVRNVTLCKFGAPALISFPHFYNADPYYLQDIDGLKPDASKHEMYLSLEPRTGLPLKVRAAFQLNLQVEEIVGITLLEKVGKKLMPAFWFEQSAELDEALTSEVKLLLVLPSAGQYTGYGMITIGGLLAVVASLVTWRQGWKSTEEEHLLNQNAL
ncbi:unnamed protein product [Phaedon cochleariae]|uniref:Uncharacterized protein n=1 Tax=Phaedon cochleariae TaxID=80249 RepID=A0A9N9SE61_PHACE|nr:unnamed protein product [Phaedon cochleariae]